MSDSGPTLSHSPGTNHWLATAVAGLITSLDIYHQFSSKFIQELHWVAQIILTLQC